MHVLAQKESESNKKTSRNSVTPGPTSGVKYHQYSACNHQRTMISSHQREGERRKMIHHLPK